MVAVAINTYAAANIDTDDQTASEVPIADIAGNYTATSVEDALAEISDSITQIRIDVNCRKYRNQWW